jgi:alkylhydroperoxidase family enzyme
LAITRTFARYPQLEARTGNFNYVLRGSPLTPRNRELLILRIGWNCQAEYEWSQHVGSVGRAREYGLEPRLIALGPAAPGWNPIEVALLRAADELYQHAMVSDGTWQTLSDRFNTAEMMSIVMSVGTYRIVSMSANAFGIQLDPGSERFPDVTRP